MRTKIDHIYTLPLDPLDPLSEMIIKSVKHNCNNLSTMDEKYTARVYYGRYNAGLPFLVLKIYVTTWILEKNLN